MKKPLKHKAIGLFLALILLAAPSAFSRSVQATIINNTSCTIKNLVVTGDKPFVHYKIQRSTFSQGGSLIMTDVPIGLAVIVTASWYTSGTAAACTGKRKSYELSCTIKEADSLVIKLGDDYDHTSITGATKCRTAWF